MTEAEIEDFLRVERTAVMCTLLADGRIHAVPMWFWPDGSSLYFTAKSKSQKIVNARRNPVATVLVEAGELYAELRGVEMSGSVEVIDDADTVGHYAQVLAQRYGASTNQGLTVQEKALNRSVIRFVPAKVASWNHAKLHA